MNWSTDRPPQAPSGQTDPPEDRQACRETKEKKQDVNVEQETKQAAEEKTSRDKGRQQEHKEDKRDGQAREVVREIDNVHKQN